MPTMRIAFRPLAADDLPLLADWLGRPHVEPWWREPTSMEKIEAAYLPAIAGEDPTEFFIITVEGRSVGLIQRYLLRDEPEWAKVLAGTGVAIETAAGIDYLIGEASFTGRGIGSRAIRTFTQAIFDAYTSVDSIVAAPQQANTGSWRALEKAGFVRRWSGSLDSEDPSDEGPAYVYELRRRG